MQISRVRHLWKANWPKWPAQPSHPGHRHFKLFSSIEENFSLSDKRHSGDIEIHFDTK